MNRLTLFVSFIALSISLASLAQAPQNPREKLSPQAQSFKRYGDIPVSLYTGTPDISIPLDTFQCGNYSLPITLSYHSGGIKVAEQPGTTGLGWTLAAGGAISRQQKCYPDEWKADIDKQREGYMYCHSKLKALDKGSLASFMNPIMDYDYDTEPDKFTFNFNGYSGFFMLDENGKWQVCSNRPVRVKSVETGVPPTKMANGVTTRYSQEIIRSITLEADDGMLYIFGAWDSGMALDSEPAIDMSIDMRAFSRKEWVAQTWYLRRIPLAEDRDIVFNYKREKYVANVSDPGYHLSSPGYVFAQLGEKSAQLVSPVLLQQITSFYGTAHFSYNASKALSVPQSSYSSFLVSSPSDPESFHYYFSSSPISEQFGNKKLQCIQIKNHLGIQKKRLEFNYNETPSARLSLRNLIFSGADVTQEEKYTFAYDNITAMPGFTETTVDHWGYTRINEVSPEGKTTFDRHTTDPKTVGYGVLTQITYPSGGQTNFVFEPNKYSRVKSLSSDLKETGDIKEVAPQYAGGVRIKRMTHYPYNGSEPIVKTFAYVRSETDTTSCGILEGEPVYRYDIPLDLPITAESNQSLSAIVNDNGFHIGYPCVIEYDSDGSKTVNEFTSVIDYPDENPEFSSNLPAFMPHTGNASLRGQLKAVRQYDSKNRLISSSRTSFTIQPFLSPSSISGFYIDVSTVPANSGNQQLHFMLVSEYKTKLNCIRPEKRTDEIFDPVSGKKSVSTTSFTYNSYGQLSSETTTHTFRNRSVTSLNKYSYGGYGDPASGNWSRLGCLTSTRTYRNGKLLNTVSRSFANVGGVIPTGYSVSYPDGSSDNVISIYRLDKYGNPVCITENGRNQRFFLWDSKYLLPVAEITNIDERDLSHFINYPLRDAPLCPDLKEKLAKLTETYPYAQVTFFEFDALDQLTGITDPSGTKTTYDYHWSGNLRTIFDHFGQAVTRYHYSTETRSTDPR